MGFLDEMLNSTKNIVEMASKVTIETAKNVTEVAGKKTAEVTEKAKIKFNIFEIEKSIDKEMTKLGNYTYNMKKHNQISEEAFDEIFVIIDNLYAQLEESKKAYSDMSQDNASNGNTASEEIIINSDEVTSEPEVEIEIIDENGDTIETVSTSEENDKFN